MFCATLIYGQDTVSYYVEFKDGQSVEIVNTTINTDSTLVVTTNKTNFNTFITNKPVYKFEKAFPLYTTPLLQRVYKMEVPLSYNISSFTQFSAIEKVLPYDEDDEEPMLLMNDEPNDFIENLQEDRPNPALDLIKAPLAWSITQGDPNIIIGIVDGDFLTTHEDLQGKIVQNLDDESIHPIAEEAYKNLRHGTAVSSIAAANTNNGVGMAAIGYNSSIITADGFGHVDRVKEISMIPGVKVINCSWYSSCNFNVLQKEGYQEIMDSGVLVVASAGNGKINHLCDDPNIPRYPASYESVVSVTSVGSRYDINESNSLVGLDGLPFWHKSWKDIHISRPPSGTSSHTHNDAVNVSAPGILVQMASVPRNYTDVASYNEFYEYGIGTSMAAPYVSGLAALVFAANPNLTAQQVKDIIEDTADATIYDLPFNRFPEPELDLLGKLGTGRINAFRAVKTAKCSEVSPPEHDFAMQNSRYDMFVEPDDKTGDVLWQSEDIWVRTTNDGRLIQTHQNPEYDPTEPNYAYVEVTNNSCWVTQENSRTNVTLYWAKASTSLSWPEDWDGTNTMIDPVTGMPIQMSGIVGTLSIPSLEIGQSKILEFPWLIPNPANYANLNGNAWHFCLLARIESDVDPMTIVEGTSISQNVRNNNNLAWKNTTIVDLKTMNNATTGGVISIGNPTNTSKTYTLELRPKANELGKAIYQEAEVSITMDTPLFDAWELGGLQQQSFTNQRNPNKKIVNAADAQLQNIQLAAGEVTTAYISFNFLTQELTNKQKFVYEVIQRDAVTNEVIGGETYEIRKDDRAAFLANAGADKEIEKNESITLSAGQIDENATYNWYNPEGELLYSGTDFTLAPDITKKYKLEIISGIDGLKDYDEVEVVVNPYKITSLNPNPASNQVTVIYDATLATSAYFTVVNTNTGAENNYIIDTTLTAMDIDTSLYPVGNYVIALICNGEFQSSKILVKQ